MKKKLILNQIMRWYLLLLTLHLSVFGIAETYTWKTVRIGGGGCTTSMQAHPFVQNLYLITTDVGTPYRWNNALQRWEGVFYNLPTSYWGKSAAGNVAFTPSDNTGNILYATIGGAWTTGGILKSTDRGDTWVDCQLPLDVKPNNDQVFGQRLAVDPQNSDVVYVTTRPGTGVTSINGTFKSTSAGAEASWTKANDLCGYFIAFDISSGTISGITKTIYLGCADGVYRSNNGGNSFSLMAGSPTNINRGVIHNNGTLIVTHKTGVSKWDGTTWSSITPSYVGAYGAVDINPNNSDQLIVGGGDRQFVSKDGGKNWTYITLVKDNSEIPWFSSGIGGGLRDFCWDPFDQNMVWFTDFFDAHQTTNIWAGAAVTWKARAVGEEETCPTGNLLCPPSGVNLLLSNVADVGGWDHKSITEPPSIGMISLFPWQFSGEAGNMTGVAVQETNPNFIARVGCHGWNGLGFAGYSTDGGATYTYWNCPADARSGRIAVSATNETMVWVTQQKGSYRSTDRGTNWTPISSLPSGIILGGDNFSSGAMFPLAADKVNGNKFYVYHGGRVYVSEDAGATFTASATVPNMYPVGNLTIETTPGIEGDIWLGVRESGLYHSTNSGTSFDKINAVQKADLLAVGKASPTTPTVPALYVFGTVNNIANSLFRSNDNGLTWETLSSPVYIGGTPICMAADRNVFGRVFFGESGNGFFVATSPGSDIQSPTAPSDLSSSNLTENNLNLKWTASSDNVGVTGYDVYQGGALIGNTASTTFNVINLTCNTSYTFTVTAKDASGNVSGQSGSVTITTPVCKSMASLTLIDADTDVSIQTLNEGVTLDLASLPTKHLNIRANTRPSTVGSVLFVLSGSESRSFIDNTTPYAFYGKVGTDYNSWTPKTGSYTLIVTPYEGLDGTGAKGTPLTRNFTITDTNPNGIEDVASDGLSVIVSSPTVGNKLTVRLKGYHGETSVKFVLNDISGRLIQNGVIRTEGNSDQVVQIDISNLKEGLFILSVISKNGKKDVKILVD
jgi:hypothetical protein